MKDHVRRRPLSLTRLNASGVKKKSLAVSIGGRSAAIVSRAESSQKSTQNEIPQKLDLLSTPQEEKFSTTRDSDFVIDHLPPVQLPPEIPENTTGKPTIGSFCSGFKVKQRKQKQAKHNEISNSHVAENPNSRSTENEIMSGNKRKRETEETVPANGPVVQIIDGEIVVQESSLEYFEHGGSHLNEHSTENYTVIEEESQLAIVNAKYTSFLPENKQRKGNYWNTQDTVRFYQALRQFGLDFCTMELMFNDHDGQQKTTPRSRKQLKRKYQMELARHPELIEMAMNPKAKLAVDLSVFELTDDAIREVEEKRAQELKNKAEEFAAKRENVESAKSEVDGDLYEEVDETEELDDKCNQRLGPSMSSIPSKLQHDSRTSDRVDAKVSRSERANWTLFESNLPVESNEDNDNDIVPDVGNEDDDDRFYKDPLLTADVHNTDAEETHAISLFPMPEKRKIHGKKKTKPSFLTKRKR